METGAARHKSAPEDWAWEYGKFADTTYPQTLQFLGAYQGNLEKMVSAAEERGVRVVLSTIVYNRFSMPNSWTPEGKMGDTEVARMEELMGEVDALIPDALSPIFPGLAYQRVLNSDWEDGWHKGPKSARRLAAKRDELVWMREFEGILATADPLIPAKVYWKPHVQPFLDSLEFLIAQSPSPEQRERAEQQIELLDAVLEIDPTHSRAYFMRGVLRYWLAGDAALIRQDLEDAGAFDRAPRRGNRLINSLVQEVAQDHPDTLFFDADLIWRERHPMQLVGWEWMVDTCHLGHGARRILMADLGEAILKEWSGTDG